MPLGKNQKVLVWIIISLCILAIPIGFFSSHGAGKGDSDSDDTDFSFGHTDHIQVIRLTGMISDDDDEGFLPSISSEDAAGALKKLRKAIKSTHVKGILLRVNSPGGTIGASQELTSQVKEYRKTGRPVVVSMGDLAASGGYYISSAADKIVCEPGTLTGSIGVIMNLMNFKGLADKVGVQPEVVKSGAFKDIANPMRPMTPEERKILQDLVMDAYGQFVGQVADGRKMKLDVVKKLADGRVYSGAQAIKLGLVDELGGYDEAIADLQKLCMEKFDLKEKLPVKDKPSGLISALMEAAFSGGPLRASAPKTISVLGELLPRSMSSRYLNMPLWMMQ
ncbi:MAG TPA: signal peptide peptidase SppA [Chroococcales cyanobacterium]